MQYLLMIYAAEDAGPEPGSPEMETLMQEYMALTEALQKSGEMIAGQPLEGVHTATTVRVRDGNTQITDGPFAETKEVLGGYYLVDCADLDAALAWAARIPTSRYGSIEVRPIMDIPGI